MKRLEKIHSLEKRKEVLKKRISTSESCKKEVVEIAQKALSKYRGREISSDEYHKILDKKFGEKSAQDWIDYYDGYIKKCNTLIKECEKQIIKEKTKRVVLKSFYTLIIFSVILSGFFAFVYGDITTFAIFEGDVSGGNADETQDILNESSDEVFGTDDETSGDIDKVTGKSEDDSNVIASDKSDENDRINTTLVKKNETTIKNVTKPYEIISERDLESHEFPERFSGKSIGKRFVILGSENLNGVFAEVEIEEIISVNDNRRVNLYWAEEHVFLGTHEFEIIDSDGNDLADKMKIALQSPSYQTIDVIIEITEAEHLDENRAFMSDIYKEVIELDNIWSETIPDSHYVRVTFEKNLTSERDITVFPRIISGNPGIEIYEENGNEVIAEFVSLNGNQYNKVFLSNLQGKQDTFDLKIVEGSVEFDHIIDPVAEPGGAVELRAQACARQSQQSTQNTFDLACAGTYPAACGGAGGDRLSCDDVNTETALSEKSGPTTLWAGVRAEVYNSDVTDCSSITSVFLCYEFWGSSSQHTCNAGVDANGGSSWTAVGTDGACLSNSAPGVTCVDVTSVGETWTCSNFFGSSGTRALAKAQALRSGGSGTQSWIFDVLFFNVTYTASGPVDDEYPIFSNYEETPANNTAYSANGFYELNVSVASTNGTVGLEFNGVNYTATNLSASEYNVSLPVLGAGTYPYYWFGWGNGSSANYNTSIIGGNQRHYTVAKATPSGFITATSPVTFGTAAGVFASESNSGDADVTYGLFRENVSVSNPDSTVLGVGTYNYHYNSTGGQNYSAVAYLDIFDLVVNQASSEVNLTFDDSEGNTSLEVGNSLLLNGTLITGDDSAILNLYKNGTLINVNSVEASNSTLFDVEGLHNITVIYSASQNYTTSFETYYVNVTEASNSAPQIVSVDAIPATDPVEDGTRSVTVTFTARDDDGFGDLNPVTAAGGFHKTGETTRESATCIETSTFGTNFANYTCTIDMWYFDGAGAWNINVSIGDDLGQNATNTTTTFTYNSLTAMVLHPGALSWPQLAVTNTNIQASNNPIVINNTGNTGTSDLGLQVTAVNLIGEVISEDVIFAGNFTVHTSDVCDSGTTMVNGTATEVLGSSLSRGNHSVNNGVTGQEELYVCLEALNEGISSQAYSTGQGGAWIVGLFAPVLFVAGEVKRRRKRKKKDILEENILDVLEEKIEEKYGMKLEDLFLNAKKDYQKKILIPVDIFRKDIGAAEVLSKYLKENKNLKFSQISKLIGRDERTVWVNYRNASKKLKTKLKEKKSDEKVSVDIFKNRDLSVLESLIYYLKKQGRRNSEIAELLGKDQRNIWTIYSRAIKKMEKN